MNPIYLDYNATTPLAPEVAQVMQSFLEGLFGNPSSPHWFGVDARDAVEKARGQAAALINADPAELIFTGCATESNNIAIMGTTILQRDHGHIITSAVEHPAVLEVCSWCRSRGWDVTVVPVDSRGIVDPGTIRDAIRKDTRLISIMHANNETGAIQPIREISGIAREFDIVFHVDAAQSTGKIPVDVDELGVDLLTVAGHKFYGPKGVGALYVRRGTAIRRIVHGANHENNLRPGTENVMGIAGMGAAAALASADSRGRGDHLAASRDRIWTRIRDGCDDVIRHGDPACILPNTLSVGFRGCLATDIMNEMPEVAVSAGAACHTPDEVDISHVLKAMDIPDAYARGTLRISTGIMTTLEEADRGAEMIIDAVRRTRRKLS